MIGALHTENMLWSVSGDSLCESGWTTVVTNSGVSTSGTAESYIGASHICRTRYVHTVSVAAIYLIQRRAYNEYVDINPGEIMSFEVWLTNLCHTNSQADYWNKSKELDLAILQFCKSCHTGDLDLHLESLEQLMGWITILDHHHYARNLPVYIRDLSILKDTHPGLYVEFKNGNFMAQKSKKRFSKIGFDHCHEQSIDWLKNLSGVIGNLDDPRTVRREQVARPEMARLIEELDGNEKLDTDKHHEQFPQFQIDYKSDVLEMAEAFEQLGNPYHQESCDLMDLDQSIVMPKEVVDNVKNIKTLGVERYHIFVNNIILSQQEAFTATISQNKLKLFKSAMTSTTTQKSKVSTLKEQQTKTTHIMIAVQAGRSITSEFFSRESSTHPPILTRNGLMHHGSKHEILDCIMPEQQNISRPHTTAAILECSVMVHLK